MRASAVVDNPVEPRLLVLRRAGGGTELLRQADVREWEQRVLGREAASLTVSKAVQQVRGQPARQARQAGRRNQASQAGEGWAGSALPLMGRLAD